MERSFIPSDYLPVLIQFIVAFGFVVITMTLTHFIGGKRKKIRTLRKEENFECGIEVQGNARFPFLLNIFWLRFCSCCLMSRLFFSTHGQSISRISDGKAL